MHLDRKQIEESERVYRLNLINSITGIKPANLVGTASRKRKPNLAIFSSVVHLGSNPALLGMFLRPQKEARRHTLENIRETGCYTINHIHGDFTEKAHYTSAKFPAEVSEFERCGLTVDYRFGFAAPFVGESRLKIGLTLLREVSIEANGTLLLIGQIEHLVAPDEIVGENGYIDLATVGDVGISGLNSYYTLRKHADFPYARPESTPKFD